MGWAVHVASIDRTGMRIKFLLQFSNGRGERDSSVGIATRYGLHGPGIESRWGARFSTPVQTGPGAQPSLLYNGYRVFPGGKAAGAWR